MRAIGVVGSVCLMFAGATPAAADNLDGSAFYEKGTGDSGRAAIVATDLLTFEKRVVYEAAQGWSIQNFHVRGGRFAVVENSSTELDKSDLSAGVFAHTIMNSAVVDGSVLGPLAPNTVVRQTLSDYEFNLRGSGLPDAGARCGTLITSAQLDDSGRTVYTQTIDSGSALARPPACKGKMKRSMEIRRGGPAWPGKRILRTSAKKRNSEKNVRDISVLVSPGARFATVANAGGKLFRLDDRARLVARSRSTPEAVSDGGAFVFRRQRTQMDRGSRRFLTTYYVIEARAPRRANRLATTSFKKGVSWTLLGFCGDLIALRKAGVPGRPRPASLNFLDNRGRLKHSAGIPANATGTLVCDETRFIWWRGIAPPSLGYF